MPKHRLETIIDIAKLAGVSKSTVARALTNAPRIKPETREAVLKAAEAVGYERNHLAVGMRSGRSGTIGLIIPDIANAFWAEVARGAQDRAEAHGRSLLLFNSDWSVERETAHLRSMRKARVEGIVVNRVAERFKDMRLRGMPLVMIGSSAALFPDVSNVSSNIEQGVRLAGEYLRRHGHERPCLIVGPRQRLAHTRFMAAISAYYASAGLTLNDLVVEESEYTPESGAAAMQRILARTKSRPLAILAVSDLIALGAMVAVQKSGLRCPHDVSIMGFDGILPAWISEPGLTSIQKPGRGIGAHSVDMLIEQVEGVGDARSVSLNCRLVERGSVTIRTRVQQSEPA